MTRVDGRALPYRMTLASANKWYLRMATWGLEALSLSALFLLI